MCSIARDPRCEECTICTALALEAVLTVRTYGDTADKPRGHDLVRNLPTGTPGQRPTTRRKPTGDKSQVIHPFPYWRKSEAALKKCAMSR
jgi:hypothetical protein